MTESNRIWRELAEKTGERDLQFTQSGSCYLAKDETTLGKFEQWLELAKQHQLDTRILSREEVKSVFPMSGPVSWAVWSPNLTAELNPSWRCQRWRGRPGNLEQQSSRPVP